MISELVIIMFLFRSQPKGWLGSQKNKEYLFISFHCPKVRFIDSSAMGKDSGCYDRENLLRKERLWASQKLTD